MSWRFLRSVGLEGESRVMRGYGTVGEAPARAAKFNACLAKQIGAYVRSGPDEGFLEVGKGHARSPDETCKHCVGEGVTVATLIYFILVSGAIAASIQWRQQNATFFLSGVCTDTPWAPLNAILTSRYSESFLGSATNF